MGQSLADKRAAFRRLHESGCFIMPNPFDAGSAVLLQSLGFKALASTSAGFAWSQARPDYGVSRDQVLRHLESLVAAVDLPVNADFENAFAHAPDDVAANVALAVQTGVAGLSVEDATGLPDEPLYAEDLAAVRVSAARKAIDQSGSGVVLTARAEAFLHGQTDLDAVIRRLKAYADAGADCLFAPGVRDEAQVRAIVQAVAPKPVNIIATGAPLSDIAGWGVRRISLGGRIAHAAYAEIARIAKAMIGEGSFEGFKTGAPAINLNQIFSSRGKEQR
ncbi:isocitrate lyase/phosphoenolpyruvate mutase family protein [uncultured Ferrovibrio sp.]|jgi:2-methylisocitrate lyase-like PEP mutase family enzyme|uniref:isocitrate lyase/PEP mutase family protein n=1 Tax=uncultured Ferrovibrio sp. TaxID=1576913 RepID=UPI002607B930|nr:isocitrate lyase/phosphoenolpyruvate mutase family protein [uncultured Ferrovibrio sp.]